MREAGARLVARDRIGRDVFRRGVPEGLRTTRKALWQVEIYDLIAAYGTITARMRPVFPVVHTRPVMTLEAAQERVARLAGARVDWETIEGSCRPRLWARRRARSASPRSPPAPSPHSSLRGRVGSSCGSACRSHRYV